MNFNRNDRIFLLILSAMLLAYIIPIILADRLYIDDILRSQLGYKRWGINGRPFADFIVSTLNLTTGNITDLSPLPLFVACASFSACALIYFRTNLSYLGPIKSSLVFFFMFANPFMLENISYKFDVLPMVLSLSILLIPYGFRFKYSLSTLLGAVCVLASLSLYQASITLFCSLALIEVFLNYRNRTPDIYIIKTSINRLLQFFIGYLAYHFVANLYIEGKYNKTHSQIIDFSTGGILSAFETAKSFNAKILMIASEIPATAYVVLFVSFLYAIAIVVRNIRNGAPQSYLNALIVISSPICIYLFTYLHLSILKYPVITDRVLISFCGFILYAMIIFFSAARNKYACIILVAPLIIFSYVYSYTYGNAMKYQKEYDSVLSQDISRTILNNDPNSSKTVLIYGTQRSSIQRDNAVARFPSLETLVPLYYTFGWWGTYMIKMYDVTNNVTGTNDLGLSCQMDIISNNRRFMAFANEKNILISFEKPSCK